MSRNPPVHRAVAEAWQDLIRASQAGAPDDDLAQLEYELGLALQATGTPYRLVFGGFKGTRRGKYARYHLVPTGGQRKNPDNYQGPFGCEMCGADVYLGQRAAVYHDDYGYVPSCERCAIKHRLPQKGFPIGILRRQSGGGFFIERAKNPRRRNSDEERRALERAAKSGDAVAKARLIAAEERDGILQGVVQAKPFWFIRVSDRKGATVWEGTHPYDTFHDRGPYSGRKGEFPSGVWDVAWYALKKVHPVPQALVEKPGNVVAIWRSRQLADGRWAVLKGWSHSYAFKMRKQTYPGGVWGGIAGYSGQTNRVTQDLVGLADYRPKKALVNPLTNREAAQVLRDARAIGVEAVSDAARGDLMKAAWKIGSARGRANDVWAYAHDKRYQRAGAAMNRRFMGIEAADVFGRAKNPCETKAEKTARLETAQELSVVRHAFERHGSHNWTRDPSVAIGGKPAFRAWVNGLTVWANSRGVIVGGVGEVHGSNVYEAVKWLGPDFGSPEFVAREKARRHAEWLKDPIVGYDSKGRPTRQKNPLPFALLPAIATGVVGGTAWESVKMVARAGDPRRQKNAGPPFGPAEAAAYQRVAGALARGGRGAVKPAAMLRRAGLLRDWELRRYSPPELAQLATGRLSERLEGRQANPFDLMTTLATGAISGLVGAIAGHTYAKKVGPRRANHPGAFIFAIGNGPGSPAHGRPGRPVASPRRRNAGGASYKIKLPADRVLGTMPIEEAARRWPDVAVQVQAFKDMNRGAEPSGEVILWDDLRKDVRCDYIFAKAPELVYGGMGGSPPGSIKNSGGVEGGPNEGTTWVHAAHDQYWTGHAEMVRGKPVTRDFGVIGQTVVEDGWMREVDERGK